MRASRLRWGLTVRAAVHGAALLAIIVAGMFALQETWITQQHTDRITRFGETFAWRVYEARDRPEAAVREAERVHAALGGGIVLCTTDGVLIATSPEAPLPCPDHAAREELARPHGARISDGVLYFALRDQGRPLAFAALDLNPLGPQPIDFAPLLAVSVLALCFVSIWLALRLSRPLERLVTVARAIGRGDTGQRVGTIKGELGEVAGAFDEMADRIVAMLAAERTLLASLSHELRTPLARIRVVLDLAREGDEERARRGLDEIANDMVELERLVDATMETARAELAAGRLPSGSADLVLDDVDLGGVLDDARGRLASAYPARRVELESPVELPLIVTDRGQLMRVLANLLDNARKYSPEASPITIGATSGGAGVSIHVDDEGLGLDDADLARATEAFYRGRASRGTPGVGLGLALAGRAVEALGGTLSFERRPSGGTRALLWLPLEPPLTSARA